MLMAQNLDWKYITERKICIMPYREGTGVHPDDFLYSLFIIIFLTF